ncbi:phage portal protein [Alkalihalophilus marmarensis]|uniref:phage portal protein n=1 Tax=Alkalihalophilus marmarensis TaxID=521377 RepID=UPI002E1F02A8|nr:phage portal protein [Alkalihalophilus marmarensis]MED1602611.1 phage portal protein [Alkalihalophilus marmarensis]
MRTIKKIRVDKDTVVTGDLVKILVNKQDKLDHARFDKLNEYYKGKHDILDRTKDANKPNNKIVANYAKFITDVMTGYFIGIPMTYESSEKEKLDRIFEVLDQNYEEDLNYQLAKESSIAGKSYELAYRNEDAELRFKKIPYKSVIPVYTDDIEENLLFVLRAYTKTNIVDGKKTEFVDVYTDERQITFKLTNGKYEEENRELHLMGYIPVIEYQNNDECMGDFEVVLSEIDAYNKSQSDTANDFEDFTDAFLALVGLGGTTSDDIKKAKEDKVLLLSEKGQAEWLVKQINDAAVENYKNRLQNDIHRISQTPDLTDEKFAGNVSGEAMKYKLWGLEQVASIKERKFKTALIKRLKIIAHFLNIKGQEFTYNNITLRFHRNIPQNVVEVVETVANLGNEVSERTKLSMLPMIDDVDAEIVRKREDEARKAQSLQDTFNQTYINGHNQI